MYDYVLIEEVSRGWDKKQLLKKHTATQRILEASERPLEAQAKWVGEGRCVRPTFPHTSHARAHTHTCALLIC